jgi:hypothetical protein
MTIQDINFIMQRDLDMLLQQLKSYTQESEMWQVVPGTTNSAGNLALHLCGNLRWFVGSVIGKSGYVRDREKEFADKNITLQKLENMIISCKHEVNDALKGMAPEELEKEFPHDVSGQKRSTGFLLLHLVSHFNYHLGQINYHRRMICAQ